MLSIELLTKDLSLHLPASHEVQVQTEMVLFQGSLSGTTVDTIDLSCSIFCLLLCQ